LVISITSLGVNESAQSIITTSSGLEVSGFLCNGKLDIRLGEGSDIVDSRGYGLVSKYTSWINLRGRYLLYPLHMSAVSHDSRSWKRTSESGHSDTLQESRGVSSQGVIDASDDSLTQNWFVANNQLQARLSCLSPCKTLLDVS
jgi:hypothetical protein